MPTVTAKQMPYEEWMAWVQKSAKLSKEEIMDRNAVFAGELADRILKDDGGPLVAVDGALIAVATVIGMAMHAGSVAMPDLYLKRFAAILEATKLAVMTAEDADPNEQPQA